MRSKMANCNLCGCDEAYLAHQVGRKIFAICGDCWYYESKIARREALREQHKRKEEEEAR